MMFWWICDCQMALWNSDNPEGQKWRTGQTGSWRKLASVLVETKRQASRRLRLGWYRQSFRASPVRSSFVPFAL